MTPIVRQITYRGAAAAIRGGQRMRNKWQRCAFDKIGKHWHANYLDNHFKESAYTAYGYQRRTRKYEAKKKAKKHHNRPLEWTGHMRKTLSESPIIEATKARVRVKMKSERYFYYYQTLGKTVDKQDELNRFTRREKQHLSVVFRDEIIREIYETTGVVTVRGVSVRS